MNPRPLSLLLVSEDRVLLRQLSRFLQAFGYQLHQLADRRQAAEALAGICPDVILVDAEPALADALELCRVASGHDQVGYIYTLLMIRRVRESELQQALEAGVDDFLSKPVVYAELLVRLRAAARTLEFERRLRQQTDIEPVSALPGRAAFYRQLDRARLAVEGLQASAACVLLDIDNLGAINHLHGRLQADAVLHDVAVRLRELCIAPSFVASLGGGTFVLLLPNVSGPDAAARADEIRQALAASEFHVGDTPLRLTFSGGVALVEAADTSAHAVVERATAALEAAKHSGRDCVVQFGQFNGETREWSELATPGKLFERTVARDVMTPWTLQLHAEQGLREATALVQHARLREAPVVDAEGKYLGLLVDPGRQDRGVESERRGKRLAEAISSDVPYCEEDTSFSQLMEIFTQSACSSIIVLKDGRPTGYVTADGLASLGKPLTTDSFAATEPYAPTSAYLRVSDD